MNVWENVSFGPSIRNWDHRKVKTVSSGILEMVRLSDRQDAYPEELSGGMQQRVAIARGIASGARILLLDEPFGALDALTRERLNQELLRVWKISRNMVVMVTHDIREAVFLADRVLVLSQRPGKIAATVPISLPRPRALSLFYSEAFSALAYEVRQAIR